jgi:ribonuclease P protein component
MKFEKSEIIKEKSHFKNIYERGIEFRGKILRCMVVRTESNEMFGKGKVVFGVSVGRNVRLAVNRNRIKRLVRESYRRNRNLIKTPSEKATPTTAMLFTFRQKRGTIFKLPTFNEVENDMKNILNQILDGTIN